MAGIDLVQYPDSELKIVVCHRLFSDAFWYMTDQIQFGRAYCTVRFQ